MMQNMGRDTRDTMMGQWYSRHDSDGRGDRIVSLEIFTRNSMRKTPRHYHTFRDDTWWRNTRVRLQSNMMLKGANIFIILCNGFCGRAYKQMMLDSRCGDDQYATTIHGWRRCTFHYIIHTIICMLEIRPYGLDYAAIHLTCRPPWHSEIYWHGHIDCHKRITTATAGLEYACRNSSQNTMSACHVDHFAYAGIADCFKIVMAALARSTKKYTRIWRFAR